MENSKKTVIASKQRVILLIAVLSLLIAGAGYFFYKIEESSIKQEKYNELKAIADLITEQVDGWFLERDSEIRYINESTMFTNSINKWIYKRGNEKLKEEIAEQLLQFQNAFGYKNIIIALPNGQQLLSTEGKPNGFDDYAYRIIDSAANMKEIIYGDFYFSQLEKKILYDVVIPIINAGKNTIAVVVLRRDLRSHFYPFLQTWPIPSKSAETVLLKAEKDSVVFLSELRFYKEAALKLKIPLTHKEIPAVQAALGKKGLFEGIDYRGVEVLSDVRVLPSTKLILLTKIDKSEIFSNLYITAGVIAGFVFILIIICGVGLALIYSSNQKNIFIELYSKEKELWRSQEKFKVTLDSLGEGTITTDSNGTIQYMNSIAEELTGWNKREARGRVLEEVYYVRNEETGEMGSNIVQKVLSTGIVKELANHTILISKSGKEIPVMDTGAPIYDSDNSIIGLVITFQDETEKRLHQKLLEESESRLRSTLDNMLEGCQIIGFDWCYKYINNTASIHNRRPKEELLGNKYMDMWPGIEDTKVFAVIKQCLEENVENVMENEFAFPDGNKGWFELRIQSIPDGVFILSYDISERKKNFNDLIVAKERAEQSDRLKAEFLAQMSHEIRTPMSSIISFTDFVKDDYFEQLTQELSEILNNINSAGKRIIRTVDLILNASEMQIGIYQPTFIDINLKEIILNVIQSEYSALAKQKGLQFTYNNNLPSAIVRGDNYSVNQIIVNLIDNAVKYTPSGNIEVLIEGDKENNIFVTVTDTGIGISEEYLPHIYEPFSQEERGYSRRYEGNGLGLSLVKKYCDLNGIIIKVETKKGIGSKFTIIFKNKME